MMVEMRKVKKKKWFSVVAPKLFNNAALGESYVAEAEQLNGRKTVNIEYNNELNPDDPYEGIETYEGEW